MERLRFVLRKWRETILQAKFYLFVDVIRHVSTYGHETRPLRVGILVGYLRQVLWTSWVVWSSNLETICRWNIKGLSIVPQRFGDILWCSEMTLDELCIQAPFRNELCLGGQPKMLASVVENDFWTPRIDLKPPSLGAKLHANVYGCPWVGLIL